MILSRTMRYADYFELAEEGKILTEVQNAIGMWHQTLHQHRLWEYTMALKALKTVFGDRKLLVADWGCGAGFLSPMLYWLGHNVLMYECWSYDNNERYMIEQIKRVARKKPTAEGAYLFQTMKLGHLNGNRTLVDAAFCISTLEHIRDYRSAFRELLSTVKPGGLVFITTDFAEDEEDHYKYAELRAGKMFTHETYFELLSIAECDGFCLLSDDAEFLAAGEADWRWDEKCRLVYDYGFGSMALIKEKR